MVEVVGVALLFALIVVSAVAYLFTYYFRYRWQARDLEAERRRLLEQVYQLQQENELLRRALEVAEAGQSTEKPKLRPAKGRDV